MSYLIHRAFGAICLICLAALPAFAEDGATVGEKIRQTQALVQTEFRQILRDEMLLTDEESQAFWPLYERYSAEKRAISERYLAAVIEFVDRYYAGDLSNEHAARLTEVYFDVQRDILDKRYNYVEKFGNVMNAIKVMRFFQLENKVQAEVNAALAIAIPLADPR